jgi:hypothetical protein
MFPSISVSQSCGIWICRQRSYLIWELHVYLVRDREAEFEGALGENASSHIERLDLKKNKLQKFL